MLQSRKLANNLCKANTVTIRTNISETIINKAKQGLINPYLLNLSFIPLKDNYEANNSPSQKIQLSADDINRGFVTVNFKLPLRYLGECYLVKNQINTNAQNGKKEPKIFLLEKHSKFTDNTQKTEAKTYFKIRNKSKKFKKLTFDRNKVQNLIQSKDINFIKNLLENHQNDKIDFIYTLSNDEKDKAVILFAYDDK